jgi:hypothetical protein
MSETLAATNSIVTIHEICNSLICLAAAALKTSINTATELAGTGVGPIK